MVEIREILEPEIAALAAVRADDQDLITMREAVGVMDNARDDADAYIEADLDFHLALAEAAANPLILSLIDSIVGLLREQRIRIFEVEGGPDRGQVGHRHQGGLPRHPAGGPDRAIPAGAARAVGHRDEGRVEALERTNRVPQPLLVLVIARRHELNGEHGTVAA